MTTHNHYQQAKHNICNESGSNVEETISLLKKQVGLAGGMSTIPTPEWRGKTEEIINELNNCLSRMIDSGAPKAHNIDKIEELQDKIRQLKSVIHIGL